MLLDLLFDLLYYALLKAKLKVETVLLLKTVLKTGVINTLYYYSVLLCLSVSRRLTVSHRYS